MCHLTMSIFDFDFFYYSLHLHCSPLISSIQAMSTALINRSLATLRTELEFLRDSEVISNEFYDTVLSQLPEKHKVGAPPANFAPTTTASIQKEVIKQEETTIIKPQPAAVADPQPPSFESLTLSEKKEQKQYAPPQESPKEYYEAMYDFVPQQSEDVQLRAGDKVLLLERSSPDWWRGSVNGSTGMFPSNYVRPASRQAPSPQPAAYPPYQQSPTISYQQSYPPQQGYYQPPPQQASMVPYQQPASPFPGQQSQVVVQQEGSSSGGSGINPHVKKFGSKLGDAAIFGAGATIGSNIVNSIF